MAFPFLFRSGSSGGRPELEGCSWGPLYSAASRVFRVACSSLVLLWGSCGILGASFLFVSFGSECFVLASIFAVCFFPYVILCRRVLFGFNSDELRVTPRIFVYLLNLSKFLIWHSRNDFRFRGIYPGAAEVITKAKVRVRFNIPLFFKRFRSSRRRRYFHRQWGARGVVASVVDGRCLVNI